MNYLLFTYIYICGIFSMGMALYLVMENKLNKMNKIGIVIFSLFHPITVFIVAIVVLYKYLFLKGK